MDILNNKFTDKKALAKQASAFYLRISPCKLYIVHTQGFHSFIREQGFFVFSGLSFG
jgi:hypothetical protein